MWKRFIQFRQRYITAPLLRQFQRVMPAMSQTEQEALQAGSVWWDAALFSGKPPWAELLAQPQAELSAEEQAFIDDPTEQLCYLLDDWQITRYDQDLPAKAWQALREQGFFGLIIPRQYGGKGFSALAHSAVVMKIASRSIAAAVTVMVPNSLGPGKLLLHYGSDKQRDYYLPRLARGAEIPCFALTGPSAGSDAGAMPDTGVVCYGEWQGERTLGVKLNWQKRYITLGPVCTLLGLAFKLYDPEHLLGEQEERGITLALIPRDTPGVEIGERHIPLDIPFQNGPNQGHDVFIPISQLIGEQAYIGQGWRMLVECLAEGRSISLPSLSVGAAKMASRYTGAYAAIRRQFNRPIGQFEGIEKPLANIAGLTYQMDAARLLTLSAIDQGEMPSVISAIVKYHLTEKYRQCINDAMDIQGGSGICLGPNNLLGRAYQAIPIAITVEGANILTRSMIIFGQGAVRAHPWVLKEFTAAQNPNRQQALEDFDQAIWGHSRFLFGNILRSFFLGLTRGRLSHSPVKGATAHYYRQLNWMSAAFALCADAAMMSLGGALKRKERLSARLGDILSELYLTSAVLKQHAEHQHTPDELPLVQWCCEQALYRMQECFRLLLRNLPWRPLAWVLRLLVFPTGLPYTEPKDYLDHQVAQVLLKPSETRDRLTAGIFMPQDLHYKQALLDQALEKTAALSAIEKTLRNARHAGLIKSKNIHQQLEEAVAGGLIHENDVQAMQELEKLREQIIAVDSFADYGQQAKEAI
jgi:acyl-CoA dehydrogenase